MFFYPSDRQTLTTTSWQLSALVQLMRTMQMTLDDLKAKVTNLTTVDESAITLMTGLSQQLRDALNDPAKIQALADQIDAEAAKLSAAITANTPASPPAPATPPATPPAAANP